MPLSTIIPAPQGAPASHNLIGTAFPSPAGLTDNRWELGFGFVPEDCAEPESWVIPCVGGNPAGPGAAITQNRGGTNGLLQWEPFLVRAHFGCDLQQRRAVDFEGRARRVFELGESKLIETELWRGDAAGFNASGPNLTLASDNADDLSSGGGATTPGLAIRILVQAAAAAPGGRRAMIHATPAVATAWWQSGALTQERNGRLVTAVGGHWVVAGTGYKGTGPGDTDPPDPDIHWAYITTPVYLLRGAEIEVVEGVDHLNNDADVVVQRTAAYYWDGCLHAGLPVNTMGSVI